MISFHVTLIALLMHFFLLPSIQSVQKLDLDEGEICLKGNSFNLSDHVCKRPENCEPLAKLIQNQHYPNLCSFDKCKPIICCPPTIIGSTPILIPYNSKVSNLKNITNEKCKQYSKLVNFFTEKKSKENGNIENNSETTTTKKTFGIFVVGGKEATPMEFPHMAILGYGEKPEDNEWGCGGSLISERWILTAAHCKTRSSWELARWARLGDLNIIKNHENAQPTDYKIIEHIIHPDYKPPSRYNDVALFRLETDVKFNSYVRPICLNTEKKKNPFTLIATGWGRTSTGGPTSDDLLKVDLVHVPINQCNNSYNSNIGRELPNGILEEKMICAGSSDGEKDTCMGDSGGPLQIEYNMYKSMYLQYGITSFGSTCGNKDIPGVYTRVAQYIPWIENIVWLQSEI